MGGLYSFTKVGTCLTDLQLWKCNLSLQVIRYKIYDTSVMSKETPEWSGLFPPPFSFIFFLRNTFFSSPYNESHYNAAPSVAPRRPWTLLATADKAGGFLVGSAGAAAPLIWAPLRRPESGGTTEAPEEGTATFQYNTTFLSRVKYIIFHVWGTGLEFIGYFFSIFICTYTARWACPPEVSLVNAKDTQISYYTEKVKAYSQSNV